MEKEYTLKGLADKEYVVRMLVGLLAEIIEDMKIGKDSPNSYAFSLLVRQLITTVRMLEEVME